ncbi:T9SS type A sorting domain-containing protein, partial [bacterium]
KNFILFLIINTFFSFSYLEAQVGKTQTLFTSVTYNKDGTATIHIPKDDKFDGTYQFFVNKSIYSQDFQYVSYIKFAENEWTDNTYKTGEIKEYLVLKVNSNNQAVSFDVVTLGDKVERPNQLGGILILIDKEIENSLTAEISQLRYDLINEGWDVSTLSIDKGKTPKEVKDLIIEEYNNKKNKFNTLYLLGHIPVPYSGHFSSTGAAYPPDGHVEGSGNHTGAWPSDLYYGDLDGVWTDATVTYEQSASERNNNRPGDGKFDQTILPSDVDLKVGRVDFYDMPVFSEDEVTLTKNYLAKAHLWRTGQLLSIDRGLIDDNFKGFGISNSGYKAINSLFGLDSLFDDRDYLTELRAGDYILSFGDGAGSYTSCNGIGKSSDFAEQKINTIFTGLAGSFFGDWDSKNNILRSALAAGALSSFWSGIPNWYLNSMGVGESIGFCTRYSQNANFGSFNQSERKIHVALMGDPTLTLRPIVPAKNITATNTMNGIELNWDKSIGDIDGYNLYRIDAMTGESQKVNNEIIAENNYIDISAPTGKFYYQLRTVKFEQMANSSFYTMGLSTKSNNVDFVSSVEYSLDDGFFVAPNPSYGNFRLHLPDNIAYAKSITIQDLTGRIVLELDEKFNSEKTINAKLPVGTYILIANTEKGEFVEKIQIIR